MKKYTIIYSNDVEDSKVKTFTDFEQAKAFCLEQTAGEDLFDGDQYDKCHHYRYEVYEICSDDECYAEKEPVYATPYYWENER